jgi:uncharacterized membrane protein YraQ (UPF0718 family)
MFESFSVAFLSIVLEAMPFVLLGTLISSIIEVFVSKEWITNKLGKGKFSYFFIAGLMGIVFPVCECAIVPIMRRLIKKGVPKGIAITFMLAVPIVNPMVLFSTFYAFPGRVEVVVGRAVLSYIGAILIGVIMDRHTKGETILKEKKTKTNSCGCGHTHEHTHNHDDGACGCCTPVEKNPTAKSRILHIIDHTSHEFIDVGRFLILGAAIAAGMQTFVSRDLLTMVSDNTILSILIMMLMAFVLSLCSEADAFIASSFSNSFPTTSILAFLIFGPMIDIKNTIMLSASFKPKFVIRLISVITIVCFGLTLIVSLLL